MRLGSPSFVLRPNTTDAYHRRFSLPLQVTGDHVRLVLDTVWTPDICCHSLLVSIVATFLFPITRHRVPVILRLPCPWLLDLP